MMIALFSPLFTPEVSLFAFLHSVMTDASEIRCNALLLKVRDGSQLLYRCARFMTFDTYALGIAMSIFPEIIMAFRL